MSEVIYQEVERAISEKLYLRGRYTTALGGVSYTGGSDLAPVWADFAGSARAAIGGR